MTIQTLEELERDLLAAVRPVYLVYGDEKYLCDEALRLLKKQLLPPDAADFDFSVFSATGTPLEEILDAARSFPMFSARRVILIENVDAFEKSRKDKGGDGDDDAATAPPSVAEVKAAAAAEALLVGLEKISPRTVVILSAAKLDSRKKFYKTCEKKFCVCRFSGPEKDWQRLPWMQDWAEKFVRKHGYRISSPAVKKIVDIAGADLQTLASELEKLINYAGKDKNIPDAAIDEVVSQSRQQSIFDLTGAVSRRDRVGALRSLGNLVSMGEHPLVVVTMLARQCRQTLIALEGMRQGLDQREIARRAGVNDRMIGKFLGEARVHNQTTVARMYIRLAAIDKQLKSSARDGRLLLEALICEFV